MDQTVTGFKKLFAVDGVPDGDVLQCETPEALKELCAGHKAVQMFIISHTDFEPVPSRESLMCLSLLKTKNDMNRAVFCSQNTYRRLESSSRSKIGFFGSLMSYCKFYSYPTYLVLLADKYDLAESVVRLESEGYNKFKHRYIEALHHMGVVGESVQL